MKEGQAMSTETNESILTKGVVAIDDRKLIGKVKDVIIDCDACGVSHYIVSSSSTNSALVLPFEKSLAVGDTFMTIQSRADFLPTTDLTARGALDDNFDLVGLDVYSRAGSHLGVIKGFDIDTTFGGVTKIDLEDGTAFERDAFVFFAPEFVFVDDGAMMDADLRAAVQPLSADQEDDAAPLTKPASVEDAAPEIAEVEAVEVEDVEAEVVEEVDEEPEAEEPADEPAEAEEAETDETEVEAEAEVEAQDEESETEGEAEPEAVPEAPEPADEEAPTEEAKTDPDAELKDFLRGKKLIERVESQDGAFVAECGDELTDEVLTEAQKHDALLLLTMSVDE